MNRSTKKIPRRPGIANTAHLPARGDGGGSEWHGGAPAFAAAEGKGVVTLSEADDRMSGSLNFSRSDTSVEQLRPNAMPCVRPEILPGVSAVARTFDFRAVLFRDGALAITPEAHRLRRYAKAPRKNCWTTSSVDCTSNHREVGRFLIYDLRLRHAAHSTVVETQYLQLCLFVDQQLFTVVPWH